MLDEVTTVQVRPSVLVMIRVTPFCISAQLVKTKTLLKYVPAIKGMEPSVGGV